MIYDAGAARRLIAGHMSNLYAGLVSRDDVIRNLEGLHDLCDRGEDPEAANACVELASQIAAGHSPIVVFPKLDIRVGPPAEGEELQEEPADELEAVDDVVDDGDGAGPEGGEAVVDTPDEGGHTSPAAEGAPPSEEEAGSGDPAAGTSDDAEVPGDTPAAEPAPGSTADDVVVE